MVKELPPESMVAEGPGDEVVGGAGDLGDVGVIDVDPIGGSEVG